MGNHAQRLDRGVSGSKNSCDHVDRFGQALVETHVVSTMPSSHANDPTHDHTRGHGK